MIEKLRYAAQKTWVRILLRLEMHEQALVVFDSMIAQYPADPYPQASKAYLLMNGGSDSRKQQARRMLESLIQTDPTSGHHWFNLGFLQEEAGQYEDACTSFTKATQLSPLTDRAWYGLGMVLIRLQRFDEAVKAFKQNTQLQPMSPYGWYQLARVHVDRHQPEEARKIIRHLKGFEPKVAAQLERETGLSISPAN